MRTISKKTPFGVAYVASSWPPVEASQKKAAAIKAAQSQAPQVVPDNRKKTVRTLLLMLAILPVFVLVYKKLKTKQKETKETT